MAASKKSVVPKLFLHLFLWLSVETNAQQHAILPSMVYHPERVRAVIFSEAGIGLLASTGLYFLWYRKFPKSRFHFFNDNSEWLQMDKVGHATTAYTISVVQNDLMRWCGVRPGTSIAIGAATGLAYMSIIEVMDGFSTHWGFSKGDMLANIAGTAIFATQQKWWGQQRIALKFSFHLSPYAQFNPKELGDNFFSRIIKDYNGQTYWLSFNIRSFLPVKSDFPPWANLAVGYGAEGMTGGTSNPSEVDGKPIPSFTRYRQFYLSPDADLYRINSVPAYNNLAYLFHTFKIPAPALEYNSKKKFQLHGLYW